ncbi:spore cortex biosynthesis protein YabQ [Desertibacillus haloalkaliphilus]|uniref:spore cortex biosynthesis protein YabQ n=1 Tax=Desertibacillus haloalkaliphilus TaxID=1328930 RepID=UPI001C2805BC|nr:spore cortex biosynthesis protein YabQ [Desertibacillus haloalkaliphilus]MBU8908439.1 spore cortex biosynthesis protein YabQ [Desertibacillus haloalkaliphilus]
MSLTVQLSTMIAMSAMGVWLGAAIDTYGRFAKQRRSFHWLVAVNDLLFWLIQGLLVFYVLLQVNQGEMRFYVLLALICGYAGYQALFRNYYQALLERLIRFAILTFRFIRSVIIVLFIRPIKWLLKLLYSLCMMVITATVAVLVFVGKVLLKPLQWLGNALLKLIPTTEIIAFLKKITYYQQVKGFIKRLFNRDDRGD